MIRRPAAAAGLAAVALAAVPASAQPPVERAPVLAAPAARDTTRPPAPRTGDSWLGTDKLRHFVLAGLVQGVAFGVATTAGARQRSALVAASAVTGLVSIGKEVHDRRRGGRVSGRDLAWDAAGGALWGVLLARSGR